MERGEMQWSQQDEAQEAALRAQQQGSRADAYKEQQRRLDNVQMSPRKSRAGKKRK